jgi:anti-repressor protein
MSNLSVIEYNGQNVVDSRLIAEELGIEHKNFLATIRKYEERLLKRGRVAFEKAPLQTAGGTQLSTFCYLNERQAVFLMTLSKNTDRVVECKDALEEAFSKAKQAIVSQGDRIRELELELELRKTEQKLLDTRNTIVQTCPEPIQQRILGYQTIKETEVVEHHVTPYGTYDGVGITYLQKRYGFRNTKQAWDFLERIGYGKDSGKWEASYAAVERMQLPRELVDEIDDRFTHAGRQRFIGE